MARTEMVAVVFTDLVSSTELLSDLGDDRFDEVRRRHFAALRGVLDQHGGTEVKNLGDGLMAVFRSATHAIAAAAAMQVESHQEGRRHGATVVGLKIGASIGDATLEDDDWFGTPVVEASRLCAACDAGQILVTETMRLMAGSRCESPVEPIGDMTLKGLAEPVATCEVRWAPAADQVGVPLPGMLAATGGFPFAGRGPERAVIDRAWTEVTGGSLRAVFIAGEPGIGKTRLVSEFCQRVSAEGALVLLGRSEDDIDAPFRPFSEALDHLARHLDESVLVDHVAEVGGIVGTIAPSLTKRAQIADDLVPADSDTERLRLFHAVADLLQRASTLSPVVLVLDDLHWADRSSLLLLRSLVTELTNSPVLILVTYRDTDLDRQHPLAGMLADFRRIDGIERLSLDGLNQAEVVEYLALAGGHDLTPEGVELGRQLAEITDGNPFFVSETLRHLAESGAITQVDGRWVAGETSAADAGVPEGIREVVGRRLSALDPATTALLSVAAVAGAQFDSTVVGAVAELREDQVLDGLDLACTRALTVEDPDRFGAYRFAHALVRQTLIEELSITRRVRLHKAIAEELERTTPSRTEEIAHHYLEAAAAGTGEKAVEYARRAGEVALDLLAAEQAVGWFRRALEADDTLPSNAERRCELLLLLGRSLNLSDEHAQGIPAHFEAAELARRCNRPDLLARAAAGYGGYNAFWLAIDDPVRPALLNEAIAALPRDEFPELQMLLLMKLATEHTFDPDSTERLALSAASIALARTLDDRHTRWEGLGWHALQVAGTPRLDELTSLADEADHLVRDMGPYYQSGASFLRGIVQRYHGDFVGAARSMTTRTELMARVGATDHFPALSELSTRLAAAGRFREAIEVVDEIRTLEGDGTVLAASSCDLWFRLWSADAPAYWEVLRGFPESAALFVAMFPLEASAHLAAGDDEKAAAAFESWKPMLEIGPDRFSFQITSVASHTAWRLGDAAFAQVLLDHHLPYSGMWPLTEYSQSCGPADLHIGTNLLTLGRFDEAVTSLQNAASSTDRPEVVAWDTWTRLFLANALDRAGRPDEARLQATRARTQATDLGMHMVIDELDRVGLTADHPADT